MNSSPRSRTSSFEPLVLEQSCASQGNIYIYNHHACRFFFFSRLNIFPVLNLDLASSHICKILLPIFILDSLFIFSLLSQFHVREGFQNNGKLSTFGGYASFPPPPLIHLGKINNIHIKGFFYPPLLTPPCPFPLLSKKYGFSFLLFLCNFFFFLLLFVMAKYRLNTT